MAVSRICFARSPTFVSNFASPSCFPLCSKAALTTASPSHDVGHALAPKFSSSTSFHALDHESVRLSRSLKLSDFLVGNAGLLPAETDVLYVCRKSYQKFHAVFRPRRHGTKPKSRGDWHAPLKASWGALTALSN